MSKEIKVNQAAVTANVGAVSGAIQCIENTTLTPRDDQSTITANVRGQEAYAKSKAVMGSLEAALEQEVQNMKSLGVALKQCDEMLSQVWKKS